MTEIFREDINGNPHSLGEDDIKKLLLEYSLPAIVGMVIVSLYHIVDSIFIGHGIERLPSRVWPLLSDHEYPVGIFHVDRCGWCHSRLYSFGEKDEKGLQVFWDT